MKLRVENVTMLVYCRNTEGLTFRAKASRQRKDLHSKRHTSLVSILTVHQHFRLLFLHCLRSTLLFYNTTVFFKNETSLIENVTNHIFLLLYCLFI